MGVAWLGGAGQIAVGAFVIAMFGCMLATTVAVVLRYRRSVGVERLQLRWLVYGAGLLPLALGVWIVIDVLTGAVDAVSVVFDLAIVTIPAAVGVAVLRYHLYDIDRLISRTVFYAALSVLLFTAFVSTAALVGVATGRVSRGGTALDPEVVTALLTTRPTTPGPLNTLTDREIQVLALMAEGRTNGGIARRLWLTEKTVENHIRATVRRFAIAQ